MCNGAYGLLVLLKVFFKLFRDGSKYRAFHCGNFVQLKH